MSSALLWTTVLLMSFAPRPAPAESSFVFPALGPESRHDLGERSPSEAAWRTDARKTGGLLSGVRVRNVPVGPVKGVFTIKREGVIPSASGPSPVAVGITANQDSIPLGKVVLSPSDLDPPGVWHEISVYFVVDRPYDDLDLRVQYTCCDAVAHQSTVLHSISVAEYLKERSRPRSYFPAQFNVGNGVGGPAADGRSLVARTRTGMLSDAVQAEDIPSGLVHARFEFSVGRTPDAEEAIIGVEARDSGKGTLLASQRAFGRNLIVGRKAQTVEIDFPNSSGSAVRFPVRYGCCTPLAYHRLELLFPLLVPSTAPADFALTSDLVGDSGTAVFRLPTPESPRTGWNQVVFDLAADRPAGAGEPLASLAVIDEATGDVLGRRTAYEFDLEEGRGQVAVDFVHSGRSRRWSFASFTGEGGGARVVSARLRTGLREGGMGVLWNDRLPPLLVRELSDFVGEDPSVLATDEGWVLVYRERTTRCGSQGTRYVARVSSDRGKSWSVPRPIASPREDECRISDGSLFRDSAEQRWHFLGRCEGAHRNSLCHFTGEGKIAEPLHRDDRFREVTREAPRRACESAEARCDRALLLDGESVLSTRILGRKGDAFAVAVGVHSRKGDRGFFVLTETKDFRTWRSCQNGLPCGALIGAAECEKGFWCEGIGRLSLLLDGEFAYVAAATRSERMLAVRAPLVSSSGHSPLRLPVSGNWEMPPTDRLASLTSGSAPSLFRDGKTTYLADWKKCAKGERCPFAIYEAREN